MPSAVGYSTQLPTMINQRCFLTVTTHTRVTTAQVSRRSTSAAAGAVTTVVTTESGRTPSQPSKRIPVTGSPRKLPAEDEVLACLGVAGQSGMTARPS